MCRHNGFGQEPVTETITEPTDHVEGKERDNSARSLAHLWESDPLFPARAKQFLMGTGVFLGVVGLLADLIGVNRQLLEGLDGRLKKLEEKRDAGRPPD